MSNSNYLDMINITRMGTNNVTEKQIKEAIGKYVHKLVYNGIDDKMILGCVSVEFTMYEDDNCNHWNPKRIYMFESILTGELYAISIPLTKQMLDKEKEMSATYNTIKAPPMPTPPENVIISENFDLGLSANCSLCNTKHLKILFKFNYNN